MTFATDNLGELEGLARTIGAIDPNGQFNSEWLRHPGDYLASILSNAAQRAALLALVDELLGGGSRSTDAFGLIWLPLFERQAPNITIFAVVDERPNDHVRIGIGVALSSSAPQASMRLHVPLFKAAKDSASVGNPLILGTSEGEIVFSCDLTVDPSAPQPGQAHLAAVGLAMKVPTGGSEPPDLVITVTGLRLPGESTSRDITLSLAEADRIDDIILDLALGLIEAQARQAGGAIDDFAKLIGLSGGPAIPRLPFDQLPTRGVAALADWAAALFGDPIARNAWLGALASLIGAVPPVGAAVAFNVGAAKVTFAVDVAAGSGGFPTVTPVLGIELSGGATLARLEAKLFRLDLGSGAAEALPSLAAYGTVGAAAGGAPLLTGDPAVESLRFGLGLDQSRRPVALLALLNVKVGAHALIPVLDLTSADAVMEAAGGLIGNILNEVLAPLGPAGAVVRLILGLTTPAGTPGLAPVAIATFLHDPLDAVRGYWSTLVASHAGAVPQILAELRDLIADQGVATQAITGTGTEADPWSVPIAGTVALLVRAAPPGPLVTVALAGKFANDQLGAGCTLLEAELEVGLVAADLGAGFCAFLPHVAARLSGRPSSAPPVALEIPPMRLSADFVAVDARWSAAAGLDLSFAAPNPAVSLSGTRIPLDIPDLSQGLAGLGEDQLDAVEFLAGQLAQATPASWVRDLADGFGWIADSPAEALADRPRLRLAALVADPAAAILDWANTVLLRNAGRVEKILAPLARVLTGTFASAGQWSGLGSPGDPYCVALSAIAGTPELAFWVEPDAPPLDHITAVTERLRQWQPGTTGLSPAELAEALFREAQAAPAIADLVSGRDGLGNGLGDLIERWTDTDGGILAPTAEPAGVSVHLVEDKAFQGLRQGVDLAEILSPVPGTVIRIAVGETLADAPWTGVPAGRLIDLTAPSLAAAAFTKPEPATGEWFVLLGNRAACAFGADDPLDIAGQAARLARILEPFPAGGIALVAEGGAGHAARRVAEDMATIDAVVTIGTPFGPVLFSIVGTEPAASTLQLLDRLLPEETGAEPFDEDLALGRDLVKGLLRLAARPLLAAELNPPSVPAPQPRATLESHALFGQVSAEGATRALTAIVAGGLSLRAAARELSPLLGGVTGAGAGLRLPISLGGDGILVTGHATIELIGADFTGTPALRQSRPLTVHVEIRRADGWLVGGPGAGTGRDLRWLEFNLTLPLGSGGAPAAAEVVLHEPSIFTIRRERWILRAGGSQSGLDETVTPTLPEAALLLGDAVYELAHAQDAAIQKVVDVLEAVGLFSLGASSTQGGLVVAALDSLLSQPDAHFAQLLAAAPSRQELQQAVDAALGAMPGLTVDLAQRRAAFTLAGAPGTVGLLAWSVDAFVSATGAYGGELRLGEPGACLRVALAPFGAVVECPRLGLAAFDSIPVWPAPDASRLAAQLPPALVAAAARIGLDRLRALDDNARPIIDAVLDALGLLTGSAGANDRRVRVPLALLSDPAGWFATQAALGASAGGYDPAKAAALLDALRGLLGLAGGPGTLALAPGIALAATSAGGALRVSLVLDGSAMTLPPAAAARLGFGGRIGLDIAAAGAILPAIDLYVGLPGAAPGEQAIHLEVGQSARLFLRLAGGSEVPLYPDPPGLGSLSAAAVQILPLVLDEVAKIAAGPGADAAAVVRALGDLLDLRSPGAGGPKFDGQKLRQWAQDPAAALAARLPNAATLSPTLATALNAVLPAGLAATAAGSQLSLVAAPLTVRVNTASAGVEIEINGAAAPFLEHVTAAVALDSAGIASFTGIVGPASIGVNGATIRPFLAFAAGANPADGRRIEVGAALDPAGADAVFARWMIGGPFALAAREATVVKTDSGAVALALLKLLLDLLGRYALQAPPVVALLAKKVPGSANATDVETVFRGVLLEKTGPLALDSDLFDPATLVLRFQHLLENIGKARPTVAVGSGLTVGADVSAGNVVSVVLGVAGRVEIVSGETNVSIEADSRWIKGQPAAGLAIGLVQLGAGTAPPTFAPSFAVNGIGLRIGKSSGPLLDTAIKLDSAAVHFFADFEGPKKHGGVQLQLSGLAVGVGGGGGGNVMAQSVLGDSSSGSNRLAPAFSPALAIQKHDGAATISLSAGEGDGPWWLSIQKGFGPLYVEQVGFGVTFKLDQVETISVLFDGRVSIAGLVAAVDDLQLTFTVTSGADLFDAKNWKADLAGLAVSADISGVTLAGGLRKFGAEPNIEYVGMLMARVATYGISIYGGYGSGVTDGQRFTAFFAFGAVTGPIGGPPAFFVTGIGGGFGINRDLVFPASLSTFADFVMIKALDPAATANPNPMQELVSVRNTFPMRRGRFWFAAGISFTCFALVDGIAIVAVSFGEGFELTLLGLARLALPRPQMRLVSIELGLLVRFSTRDGVMWIQAELTENSWLLHESVRLTGGFAFVTWFSGPRKGEFVLTLGGYHPSFHRDGYPQVPRLGFRWQVSGAISIKGENYFALTSEAFMAGGGLEVSADFGLAWASVSFGANVIIYFDPFRYEADAHARISAGVTIDTWFGDISFSVSLGASIQVAGPQFHGSVTFEVGPIDLTVEFGSSSQSAWEWISWEAFAAKYLEISSPGVARVLTALPGKGSLPPGTGGNGAEKGTADGSLEKPFELFSEFELMVTSIAPATRIERAADAMLAERTPSRALGLAPVGDPSITSVIRLGLYPLGHVGQEAENRMAKLPLASSSTGGFPAGAWGIAQSREDKKVPGGDIIEALNGGLFVAQAMLVERIPAEVDFHQVEPGTRKPLPFVSESKVRSQNLLDAQALSNLISAPANANEVYATIEPWLGTAGNSRYAMAALRGGRAAPPMIGTLGERLAAPAADPDIVLATPDVPVEPDVRVAPPRAIAVLAPIARREVSLKQTRVASPLPRTLPPTFEAAEAMAGAGVAARLVRMAPRAAAAKQTMIASSAVPLSRQARMAPAAIDARGADSAGRRRLDALSSLLGGDEAGDSAAAGEDAAILAGEVAIFAMPAAARDSGADARPALGVDGLARVVMLGAGGTVLSDTIGQGGNRSIPQGVERIALWADPADPATAISGLSGWHESQSLAYLGWSTCLCSGASVYAESAKLRRGPESFKAGWIGAREFVQGSRLLTTRFTAPAATLVVVLEEANAAAGADFSLTLQGASVARDAAGADIAPILLSSGTRRILVYAIVPERSGAGFAASVLREGAVRIAGAMASARAAALVAAQLTERAPEALVDPAVAGPGSPVSIHFIEPAPPNEPAEREAGHHG